MKDFDQVFKTYLERVQVLFGERILFLGLQGSYARGEHKESSDIDAVVILDYLDYHDLFKYRKAIKKLDGSELICGFISGRNEIESWSPVDLFHFYFDTKPVLGNLDFLKKKLTGPVILESLRIGLGNLYHGCVHNYLFEKSREVLSELYKQARFLIQEMFYLETGRFVRSLDELIEQTEGNENSILISSRELREDVEYGDFGLLTCELFNWIRKELTELKEKGSYFTEELRTESESFSKSSTKKDDLKKLFHSELKEKEDKLKVELIEEAFTNNIGKDSMFWALKEAYSEQEWAEFLENDSSLNLEQQCAAWFLEDRKDRIFELIAPHLSLKSGMDTTAYKYAELIYDSYGRQILDIFSSQIRESWKKSNLKAYEESLNMLNLLREFKGNSEYAQDLAKEWINKYPRRKAVQKLLLENEYVLN